MQCSTTRHPHPMNKAKTITATTARILLGVVFIFSGLVKAIDPLGTTYKIEDYLKAFGGVFNYLMPLAEAAAVCLITLEFLLGICLLLNVRTQWTSWITLVFYCIMTPLTLYIAIANPVSDCGCFGDALIITNWQTFIKNVILIVLAITLVVLRKEVRSFWHWYIELAIAAVAVLLIAGLMLYTNLHLPIMDFRPYKVGNNIVKLMEYPEDAEPDEYETTFVYSKDGQEQTFTIDNYPKGDSAWTFVRQNSKLIKKGYEPPIHDFEIMNADYEDITYDILESEAPIHLVIMYDLQKSDKKQMDKVVALCTECAFADEPFYILTGSGTDEIVQLALEYPEIAGSICTCDPVTLKTIVRANPGVIVIQNGTIIEKYNLRNKSTN